MHINLIDTLTRSKDINSYRHKRLKSKSVIEVYKTNVQHHAEASKIKAALLNHFPNSKINFDLEDCDKILRVEACSKPSTLIEIMHTFGFKCEELPD